MLISCEYDTGDSISKVKYRDGGYKKYTYDEYDKDVYKRQAMI